MRRKLFILLIVMSFMSMGCSSKENQPDEPKVEKAKDTDNQKEESDEKLIMNGVEIRKDIKLSADTPVAYSFANASVHDPSIIEVDGTYYVFGSHLAAAKTTDFMNWTMIGSGVNSNNSIIKNVKEEMREALEWAKTDTFWAPDVIQLADGKFYMYYCTCEGSMPLASLGIAVADQVEGPYKDLGIILKSGMGSDIPSENGDRYNAGEQPNAIDPALYYDAEGRLWMMYGSYSGGIFVLEMDPNTGFPLEKGYGKKILGGNHVRIEGAYVLYNQETEYYYMFLSYGGLAADGGYNIRVARSKNPDGPYYDANDVDMIKVRGASGTFFSDNSIYRYGVKLMGGYRFSHVEGETSKIRNGYVSPGHNSAYFDEETGKYFLIFHSRFELNGEGHEVRVHQMYFNEDGWPIISPYRYVGESKTTQTKEEVTGIYKYINHGNSINDKVIQSEIIELKSDNTIVGAVTGTWDYNEETGIINLTIDSNTYNGIATKQWDEQGKKNVIVFTALSEAGFSIWGSGLQVME